MSTKVISQQLRAAAERKELKQVTIANGTNRAKTTINGYFRGDSTPLEAMEEIAIYIDDSVLNQHFTHEVFNWIPPMESETYKMDTFTLEIIKNIEQEERESLRARAKLAMTKREELYSEEDKEAILQYALNYLDEVFIEIRYIVSIFDKLDMSMMSAIQKRIPDWRRKKYIGGE
ncbi:hypothetical protein [Alkalibacterium sp. MB6]|uniref:hypothetical protein n=1 Tax=Alkalibacterium sp. MB6 TaxID=2081965 RepID=UPI001379DD89|nr:hypothetical protein [Alkalibacterium sp. MB6]